jgi:hypothetical protein
MAKTFRLLKLNLNAVDSVFEVGGLRADDVIVSALIADRSQPWDYADTLRVIGDGRVERVGQIPADGSPIFLLVEREQG